MVAAARAAGFPRHDGSLLNCSAVSKRGGGPEWVKYPPRREDEWVKYPPRRERTASAMVGRRMMVIADGVVDVDDMGMYPGITSDNIGV